MANRRRVYMVAERIREIIAAQLNRVSDPRLTMVTITHVVPSSDLRQAKVYWVTSGDDARKQEVADAFDSASGFFRRGLSQEMNLRFVPELRFYYDETLDTAEEIETLFEKARQSTKIPEEGK